jgi:hypothetical protein
MVSSFPNVLFSNWTVQQGWSHNVKMDCATIHCWDRNKGRCLSHISGRQRLLESGEIAVSVSTINCQKGIVPRERHSKTSVIKVWPLVRHLSNPRIDGSFIEGNLNSGNIKTKPEEFCFVENEIINKICVAVITPENGVVKWTTGFTLLNNNSFSLIRNTDCTNIGGFKCGWNGSHAGLNAGDDVKGIVFESAGFCGVERETLTWWETRRSPETVKRVEQVLWSTEPMRMRIERGENWVWRYLCI